MPETENHVPCYNRGCGKSFDPSDNEKDECHHHPGQPVFHDAYKGWSCCNKKSINFTEFLNFKGCAVSKHSNVKPAEPEKKPLAKELDRDVIEVKAPNIENKTDRPPFDTTLVKLEATVAESLKQQLQTMTGKKSDKDGIIEIGTSCKNSGCSASYNGPQSNEEACVHHPGCPIFHEGLKFWSCCQKRTTDFNVFLNQPGCMTGTHKWVKEVASGTVKCRWDWHQTSDTVIVSVYAKKYDPVKSFVKLNPVRLNTRLVFPEEGDSVFELDLELRGVIEPDHCSASMLSTKVEIRLRKAVFGPWSKLDFPRIVETEPVDLPKVEEPVIDNDLVDLSDVETVQHMYKVNISDLEQVE